MAELATSRKSTTEAPPPSTLVYFLCCHILGFLVVASCGLLLFGTFTHPRTVGLFFTFPYVTYIFVTRVELQDGASWPWFSQEFLLFQQLRRALHLQFCDFPKDATQSQYLYACHPHGVFSDYRILMDGMFCQKGVYPKTLAATILFRLPLVREMALWTGCVDARRSVAEKLLHRGDSVLVLPGGEAEQIRTTFGREIVYLKKRKGFIKLAIRQGVPVVPMYVFGVSDYYYTSDFLMGPRMWLQRNLQICWTIHAGFGGSPFCPLLKPTTVVFGDPLKFDQCDNPSTEQLDKAHNAFMESLTKLFDKHKDRLGYGDRTLEIL